jgi:hypothetical protein
MSGEQNVSFYKTENTHLPWRREQYVSPKHRYISTQLQGLTSQKTVISVTRPDMSRESVVGTVTGPRVRQPRNRNSNSGKGERYPALMRPLNKSCVPPHILSQREQWELYFSKARSPLRQTKPKQNTVLLQISPFVLQIIIQQFNQCTINATSRRVRVTIVAAERQ